MEIISFGSSSAGNSYLLNDGDSTLLLEAGINPIKMRGLDWSKVVGVLVTHSHLDHSRFVKQILGRCASNVYCTPHTASTLDVPEYRLQVIEAQKQFEVKGWKVLPFSTEHDVESVGYLIQSPNGSKVLFATDTYYIKYNFTGLTHIMIECNFDTSILQQNAKEGQVHRANFKRILRSHFSIENVVQYLSLIDLSDLKEVHLLHLSDRNSDEESFKRRIQAATGVPVYVAK